MGLRAGAALAVLLGLALGCAATVIPAEQVPEARIAGLYRNPAETERVVKSLAEKHSVVVTGKQVLDLNEVGGLLSRDTSAAELTRQLGGRLAFVDPRTAAVEVVRFATPLSTPVAWSADRSRLLFRASLGGSRVLTEWLRASGEVRRVGLPDATYLDGAFLGGDEMVLTRSLPNGGGRLVRWSPSIGEIPLTDGPTDYHPAALPDGSAVVFSTVDPSGEDAIGRVELARPGLVRLLTRGHDPVVTPDGSTVVYSALVHGKWKLWRMHPDGSGKHPFGSSPYDEHSPSLSPDGRFVAYLAATADPDPTPHLMIRDLADGRERPVVVDGTVLAPVW